MNMAVRRIERGCLYEDFPVGRVFEHHWGRTFTPHDGVLFSSMTMNYNPIYFNEEYARRLGYDGVVINPLLVWTTALGLTVEDLSEAGGPFLGVDDLRFHRPVYAGDTIYARSVVLSRRESASRPGWGIVEWKTTATNQRGELILEYRRRNLSRRRESAKKASQ
jgi:itaconyl-CoA hydratase